jgi:hypothetical protein
MGDQGFSITVLEIVSTECLKCKKDVSTLGKFFALGPPLHGVLCSFCAPYYDYPNLYPHKLPMVAYRKGIV